MPIEPERDPKSSLIFYITIPETEVGPVVSPIRNLFLTELDKYIADAKKALALVAARKIIGPKLRPYLPTGSHGGVKEHVMKRPKAGTTPAHYRLGIKITFANPSAASKFAKDLKIP